MLDRLLSIDEAAKVLGIPVRTFRKNVRPTPPVVPIGRRKMVRPSDLDRWIGEHIVVGGVQGAEQASKATPHPIKVGDQSSLS